MSIITSKASQLASLFSVIYPVLKNCDSSQYCLHGAYVLKEYVHTPRFTRDIGINFRDAALREACAKVAIDYLTCHTLLNPEYSLDIDYSSPSVQCIRELHLEGWVNISAKFSLVDKIEDVCPTLVDTKLVWAASPHSIFATKLMHLCDIASDRFSRDLYDVYAILISLSDETLEANYSALASLDNSWSRIFTSTATYDYVKNIWTHANFRDFGQANFIPRIPFTCLISQLKRLYCLLERTLPND